MAIPSTRDAVLADYPRNLIKRKAAQLSRQRGFVAHEAEDIENELILRLLHELPRFDDSRGHVNPFIKCVIETAIAMIARERLRQKRGGGERSVSLNAPLSTVDETESSMASRLTPLDAGRRLGLVPTATGIEEQVTAAIASLPSRLQGIARALMDGTISSVALARGISRRQLRNAIAEIRRRFEKAGFGESEE